MKCMRCLFIFKRLYIKDDKIKKPVKVIQYFNFNKQQYIILINS